MSNVTLNFGDWTPDDPDIAAGCTIAKNVIPHKGSYRQFKGLSVTTDALTAYARGAASYTDRDNNVETYAGDATKLYRIATNAWVDKSSATYTTGTKDFWQFTKWGENVIATNYADPIQIAAFGNNSFADLGGSPDKAKHIATVRSFLVIGDVNDGTHYPNRVRWSGQNLETSWGSNPATQADYQDLVGDGGKVQAIAGGEIGVVFQERAMWLMTYEGPPIVFRFDEIGVGLGTPAPRSVVRYGDTVYFLGQDGFYQYIIGQGLSPIGDKKVDLWLDSRINKDAYHRMVGAIDIPNGKVAWAYATGSGDCDEIIIYDYKTQKWSYVETDTQVIYSGKSAGYTLEGLDAISASLDALPASLDADQWKGGSLALYGFDTANKNGAFNGSALTATLESVEMARDDGAMIYVDSVRPLVQGAGSANTVYIAGRNNLNDNYAYGSAISVNSIGEHNSRVSNRYLRFKCDTAGGFDHAVGVRLNVKTNGVR